MEWIDALPLFPWHSGTGLLAGGAALGLLAAAAPGSGDSDDRPLEFPSPRHVVAEDQAAHGEIRNSHGPADGLAYALGTPPAHGSVTIKEDGSYIYTPERGYSGPDSFVIMVTDSKGRTAESIVELEITPVNDPPTSEDAQHTVAEDGSVSGQIDANDADGDALTYSIDEQPENGSVVLNPDGSYAYTPDPDYHGTDSFTVLVDDGNGGTTTSTVSITVTPEDDPVTAHDDSFSTPEDTPLTLDLLANDVAPDGGLALVSIAGVTLTPGTAQQIQITGDGTSAGTVIGTIDIDANGKLVLSPAQDYNGTIGFDYVARDVDGSIDTASVSVNVTPVNDDPTSQDAQHTVPEDGSVSGQIDADDVDGDTLAYSIGEEPENGSVVLNPDGGYTYTPAPDYHGTDSFTVLVDDGNGGTTASTITITVTPEDDPVTAHDDSFSTPEDAPLTLDLLANDVAPDGGLELVSIAGVTLTPGTAQQIAITDDGTSTGTVIGTIDIDASGELVLTPALDYNGTIGFDYVARDVDGSIDTASVSVNVTPVNDAPVAKPDTDDVEAAGVTAGGNADKAGTPTATGNVLDNDTDVDMVLDNTETLEVIGFSLGDDDGTLGSALQGKYGSLVLAADGTYTYTLDNDLEATQALAEGETADEVFHYTIADSEGAQASSTLTITVTGSNDRPLVTSDASAAQGSVTEGGTDNTGGEPDATGTLVASDPDGNATLTWGIVDGDASPAAELDGTYGILRIDPGTGKWTYELDNERSATQELNEGDTETDTFTVRVSDEHGAYSEQTITISVSGSNDKLEGIGDKTERFSEDPADGFAGTLQDYVSDADDEIVLVEFTVDGATYSPGDTATISNVGSLSIALDGDYVFTPLEHYSGPVPTITYTVAENRPGGEILTQDLTFEITPVADKPQVEADKTVPTSEDTTVALHLAMPAVVDGTKPNTTEDGDDPERLGAITLQLGGAGAAGATLETTLDGASPLVLAPAADGTITVIITDSSGAHDPSALHIVEPDLVPVHGTPGVYYLTPTEYAAIHAQPGEYAHENFTVTVNVSSYEVDGSGAPLAGIDPAPASQVVTVDVHAVTNQPGLGLLADLDGVDLEDIGAQSLTTTAAAGSDKARIDAAMNEGAALDLSDILLPVFADGDGSEHYWFEISRMPPGTSVKVAGTEYLADPSGTATMPESAALSTDGAAPSFVITLPEYYSNTAPINAVVTLHARDTDGDSTSATPGRESVSVDLNLRVFAQPDDVKLPEPAAAAEDTPIAFLAGLAPLDDDGSESITQIRIADLPSAGGSWTLRDHAGHGIPMPSDGSDLVLAVGADAGAGEYTLEQIKAFTLLPPAHSSLDGEIIVHITTSEAGVYTDDGQPLEHEWAHSLSLAVLPVAERVNSDNDVTMNGDHQYGAAGREDAWFALGTDTTDASGGGGFAMANAWSNVDAGSGPAIDEFTYAVLTPSLVAQDHQDYSVSGTTFRYHDGSSWSELVYTTDPVWVPAEYLDSLQVRAPENVSGTLQVQMQAGTVDYDDDAEPATRPADPPKVSGPGVDVQLSGSATLSMIELEPVADVVTLALNGHASGREDEAIPLAIRATSSDPSETIDLTIEDIPSGATLYYDGSPVAVSGGTATIENFEPGKGLAIKPPPYSNSDFPLRVFAQSVDGNDRSMATAVREI